MIKIIILAVLLISSLAYSDEIKQNKELQAIYRDIRCIKCQGETIETSDSNFARMLRIKIAKMYELGLPRSEIKRQVLDIYGEHITMSTNFSLNTVFLWMIPFLTLVVCCIIAFIFIKNKNSTSL